MLKKLGRTPLQDQRRFMRIPHRGSILYRYASSESAAAHSVDVSHGGVCLALGRYLKPGRFVLLTLEPGPQRPAWAELKAQIAWCRPTSDPHVFLAGAYVFRDEPEVAVTMSELVYHALHQGGWISSGQDGGSGLGWSVDGQPAPVPLMAAPVRESNGDESVCCVVPA